MKQLSITKLTLYRSDDFLRYLIQFFNSHPCPLCGIVHKFHNHGQVIRLVRDKQMYENVSITIFVHFCPLSEKAGTQYTKRMLPPFVIPECNINLENSMQLVEQFPKKTIDYDKACQILGTCHETTVKRHYRLIAEIMRSSINLLMAWLATHPLLSKIPTPPPTDSLFSFFMDTYDALLSAKEKLSGYTDGPPKEIIVLTYVLMIKKARKPLLIPLDLNCLILFLFDTS